MSAHEHAGQSTTSDQPVSQPGPFTAQGTAAPPRGLNPLQRDYLLKPLEARRVRTLRGMNHLEAFDIRRWLTRIFGFGGWSLETLGLDLVRENPTKTAQGRDAWAVLYRAQVRLTVRDPYGNTLTAFDDAAAGDAILPGLGDAHDMAMKTALSQAVKRCAVNLGDQFGLSLYNGGGHFFNDGDGNRLVWPMVQATMDVHGMAQDVEDRDIQGEQEAA
ncbi:Rad52/Rad22 family DNA repair protein [Streptomyces sp. NPDC102364]|uniref:Rad52/Rad22 family DNA repair protein n=1 Tax=Streptomyces sp. NPDC102364 TaxID=3366161 RepID=UPI0038031B40